MNIQTFFDPVESVVTVKWSGNHGWVTGQKIHWIKIGRFEFEGVIIDATSTTMTIYITKWY